MRGLWIAAALVAAPGVASAQYYQPYQAPTYQAPTYQAPAYTPPSYGYTPQTTYDYNSGNTYTTTPTLGGGAQVRGYNLQNGTSWNTNIQSNGNMSGVDAGGNAWNYNRSTGTYMNYGTGTICTGQGYARVCN